MASEKAVALAHYVGLAEEAARYRAEQLAVEEVKLPVDQSAEKGARPVVSVNAGASRIGKSQRCVHCRRMGDEQGCRHVIESQVGQRKAR